MPANRHEYARDRSTFNTHNALRATVAVSLHRVARKPAPRIVPIAYNVTGALFLVALFIIATN